MIAEREFPQWVKDNMARYDRCKGLERKALEEALLVWRFRCFNRYFKSLSSPQEMSALRKNQQARHTTLLENL
jgi:hypothetical protein